MLHTVLGTPVTKDVQVDNLVLVLQGEHSILNSNGTVTPVNLGKYTVEFKDGKLLYDEERLAKELEHAIRAILLTYVFKQQVKEK